MSQDKSWDQWMSATGQPGSSPEEKPAHDSSGSGTAGSGGSGGGGVDADILAAWLKALPPADPAAPPTSQRAPGTAEPAAIWPPAAPVDPFTGIQKSSGPVTSDWDLALDNEPIVPPVPAAPAGPGIGDFAFHSGSLAGPVPAANPFAPAEPIGASYLPPPAPPAGSLPVPAVPPPAPQPFGPPLPPVAPPAEALEAPPLRLQVTTGRRTTELEVQGEALIGRPDATRGLHPEIDLRLDDAVSRRHAKIFMRNGSYVLTDLNSTNGTRYNREWLQPEKEVVLKPGDEIEVGELTVIRVLEVPPSHA